jgi:hypothetical protein
VPTLEKTYRRTVSQGRRSPAVEVEVEVYVLVTFPNPRQDGVGIGIQYVLDVDPDLEDAVSEKTKKGVLATVAANGGLPPGGLTVLVRVTPPPAFGTAEAGRVLPEVVCQCVAESVKLSLSSLR